MTHSLLQRRAALLGSAYRLFYDEPLHIVRGEGVHLFDAEDRRYLDMYNNVPHVGHCHPHVVARISEQLGCLNTHTRYLHETVLDYSERLIAKFPDELNTAMFACTGSEANELALRIARAVTGGHGLVVVEFAYHGNSQATAEISPESWPHGTAPDHVRVVPVPNRYSGVHRGDDAADAFADTVANAIADLENHGIPFAAVVIDTIVSGPGVVEPPPGYLTRVASIARAAGGLFIADEVQPGFGRTGCGFWGFEADGVIPDIVTMGKPMGNGHPLSAVVARAGLIDVFSRDNGYFNTFGGNPVSAAAGMAVLDVIEEEGLQANALTMGEHLKSGLASLAATFEIIGDVRGHGLFLGVELVSDRETREPATTACRGLVNELRRNGVLTGSVGPRDNILKLRPPMVLTQRDADVFLEQCAAALVKVTANGL